MPHAAAESVAGSRFRATVLLAAGLVQVTTLALTGCTAEKDGADRGTDREPASHSVSATIQVGQGTLSVAITPDGRFAYTVNQSDVSVIDLGGNSVVATLPLPGLKDLRFGPDGQRAYVAGGSIAGFVSLIDTADRTETAPPIPVAGGPLYDLAVSPDGRRAYVANRGGGLIAVDMSSRAVKTRVSLPDGDRDGIALSPDGRRVYVASSSATSPAGEPRSTVSVVDTATNRVDTTIPLAGGRVDDLAVTRDGQRIYATHFPRQLTDSNVVSVIDTASGTVGASIPVQGRSTGLALTPDGRRLYTVSEAGLAQAISTDTGQVTASVQVGSSASGIAIAPDGRHAYVTDYDAGRLSVIDIG